MKPTGEATGIKKERKMSDDNTIFRTKTEVTPTEQPTSEVKSPAHTNTTDDIEVPYLDYEKQNAKPYSVDYFKLGDTWMENVGGFPDEVASIEGYISKKINEGEIANSVNAVKNLLKGMEKMNNLTHEERPVVKIEILANYVEFLSKNEQVKSNLRRYNANS